MYFKHDVSLIIDSYLCDIKKLRGIILNILAYRDLI